MKMITILLKNKHIVLKKTTIYVILCVLTTFCMLYKYLSLEGPHLLILPGAPTSSWFASGWKNAVFVKLEI